MRRRIVFVNLHTDWMLLKVADVILFKNSTALKHRYLFDYLLNSPEEYEICTYLNSHCFSLYCKGSAGFQKLLRPIGILEHYWIMKKNGINKNRITVLKDIKDLRRDDIIILYNINSAEYHEMDNVVSFKALSMLHFHGRANENEIIQKANVNCLFNEVNLEKVCELYRRYYQIKKPWIVHPFVYAERFQNIKPFSERKNMAFATGTITYKIHKEFLDTYGDPCDQPTRKQIRDDPTYFQDTIYCTSSDYLEDNPGKIINEKDYAIIRAGKKIYNRTHVGKQTKYFSFDMVEAFNNYKMCIVGEEILGIPGIGFVEGMACGCAYIGQDLAAYRDWGLVPGVHFITYDGTKENLKSVIEYYQMEEHQRELERIASTGYEFVRSHFNGNEVAKQLMRNLEKLQEEWIIENE